MFCLGWDFRRPCYLPGYDGGIQTASPDRSSLTHTSLGQVFLEKLRCPPQPTQQQHHVSLTVPSWFLEPNIGISNAVQAKHRKLVTLAAHLEGQRACKRT